MRIIYLYQYFSLPNAPGSSRGYEMARRLVEAGHEVHMVTSDRSANAERGWQRSEAAGIQIHTLGVPYDNRMSFPRRIVSFGAFALAAMTKAHSLRGDVIFATSTPLTIAIPGAYAAKRGRVPMVFEVRDLWPEVPIALGALPHPAARGAARRLERFAYDNSTEIIALSEGMKAGVVRRGVPPERVTVIPNCSDIEIFDRPPEDVAAFRASFPWLGDRPMLVYTGALGIVNGLRYAARLAAAVRKLDPEFRFVIIGEGREEEEVRAEAKALGVLDETFFMLPPMPKDEMAVATLAATVATSFVIDVPELWNNSANKFFDGFAAGVAFAVNHYGWQAELLEETGAGLVLHPTDIDEAARTLVSKVHDPVWLKNARAASRKLGRERFARDDLAAQLEQVLVRAAGRR